MASAGPETSSSGSSRGGGQEAVGCGGDSLGHSGGASAMCTADAGLGMNTFDSLQNGFQKAGTHGGGRSQDSGGVSRDGKCNERAGSGGASPFPRALDVEGSGGADALVEQRKEEEVMWHPRVEVGWLNPVERQCPCIVICEQWPGWSWALEGLPFGIQLVALGSRAAARWVAPSSAMKVVPLETLNEEISKIAFLSGSLTFLET